MFINFLMPSKNLYTPSAPTFNKDKWIYLAISILKVFRKNSKYLYNIGKVSFYLCCCLGLFSSSKKVEALLYDSH